MTGSSAWSGLPVGVTVAGTAGGAVLVSSVMRRRGRRVGLWLGYTTASVASLAVVLAVVTGRFGALLVGMLLMGAGHGANQLSRYAAADLHAAGRRSSVLSWIVWASTFGALAGPLLVAPFGRVAAALALPPLSGGYLLAFAAFLGAAGLHTRAAWHGTARHSERASPPPRATVRAAGVLRLPTVQMALATLVVGYVVMVLIMTVTPLYVRQAGHDLSVVGMIMSAHAFGMFGLAPVVGGLADRLGSVPIIAAGLGIIAIAAISAAVIAPSTPVVFAAVLFLLGLGWSCGFVAASTHLTHAVPARERPALEGGADSVTWAVAAVGSVVSGLLMSTAGYPVLSLVAAALLVLPLLVMGRRRHSVV